MPVMIMIGMNLFNVGIKKGLLYLVGCIQLDEQRNYYMLSQVGIQHIKLMMRDVIINLKENEK